MGRITVDGTQTQFSCKLSVDPKLWDTKGGRVTGRSTAALETNRLLDKMRVRINGHYQEIMERDNFVTAEKVKNAFLGLEHRCHTLMQVFRQHNEGLRQAGGGRDESQRHLAEIPHGLQAPARVPDRALPCEGHRLEGTYPGFHLRLRDVPPHGQVLLHQYRMAVRLPPADDGVHRHQQRMADARPVPRKYEIKKEETTRTFLTKEEIRLLMEGKLKNAKQELYRDLYLFCAFTGLSFSDMRNLREENIRTYFDNHEWININRQKTGVESNIRLLDIAKRIIDKYRGLCEDGRIFPVPHYMTCLYGIRSVAKRCGITKHITWHQSRHTAATTVFLSNGVPIETVSSMLGHKSIKTTQIYAKITKEKLNQDMENLVARLDKIEEFAGCNI